MRVLLVEDDLQLSGAVARGLREASYAVDLAHDGDRALYLAGVNPYDVVVLDVMLPGKTGLQVARILRDRGSNARILMLTARDAVEDRVAGLDAGADDYLVKPFAFTELMARIRALLRRTEEVQHPVLRVGDLEIDTRSQQVARGGESVRLTHREYALLEYLARNAGRVVGRAEISEHVWDDHYDPFSNLIEVYISRLRNKLDSRSDEPLIHTRRGAGYVLTDQPPVEEGP